MYVYNIWWFSLTPLRFGCIHRKATQQLFLHILSWKSASGHSSPTFNRFNTFAWQRYEPRWSKEGAGQAGYSGTGSCFVLRCGSKLWCQTSHRGFSYDYKNTRCCWFKSYLWWIPDCARQPEYMAPSACMQHKHGCSNDDCVVWLVLVKRRPFILVKFICLSNCKPHRIKFYKKWPRYNLWIN